MPYADMKAIKEQLDKNELQSKNIIDSLQPHLITPQNLLYLRKAVRLPLMKFIRTYTSDVKFSEMTAAGTRMLLELAVELIKMSKANPEDVELKETDEEEIT